jgi:REP element-mobilizing transposase RayT
MFPAVDFTGIQAREVALAFGEKAQKSDYSILACAVMRNHAHLVFARHRYDFVQIANLLKGAATTRLLQQGLHPLASYRAKQGPVPSPWASRCWKEYLDSDEDVYRAIKYVEDNPGKEGKKRQHWSFVVPYVPHGAHR